MKKNTMYSCMVYTWLVDQNMHECLCPSKWFVEMSKSSLESAEDYDLLPAHWIH